jgi:hypothetical protein
VLDIFLDPVTDKDFAPVIYFETRARLKATLFGDRNEPVNMDHKACVSSLLDREQI